MKSARYLIPICALAAGVVAVSPAFSAKVPNGTYQCTQDVDVGGENQVPAGTLKIKGKKYTPSGKKSGKFTFKNGSIKFKTGPYKSKYKSAILDISGSGSAMINLLPKKSGTPGAFCILRK